MPDPAQEPALLNALETLLAPCSTIVTFNGKTFDLPLLETRYVANGRDCPFADLPHLDLLSLARRLWRSRLPSRALGHLEQEVLGVHRETSDVPGWMIPELYFDYLRGGDARPLTGVFYHNAVDLLSMAALLNHAAALLADPLEREDVHPLDLADMGSLFRDLDHVEMAAALYERAEAADLPPDARQQIVRQWSLLEKRRGNLPVAMRLWHSAAAAGHIYAHVELAKAYEHQTRNLQGAIFWTQLALDRIAEPGYSQEERSRWADELAHRLARLHRLAGRSDGNEAAEPDCGNAGP
jgi:TPR repeat protein